MALTLFTLGMLSSLMDIFFQISMNVLQTQTHVMLMLIAPTLMGVMCAHVRVDMLETGFHVQVTLI